ncbi:(2Fe-2S)-binding protein [beta proteobacterium AAP51]|nr:(2Fe-2S)-binding protein [beta proteobacterium AAP51]
MRTALTLNGHRHAVEADPATPLLWVLRDELQLTGTKYGCGAGFCGACTVHLDGVAVRSCVLPLQATRGRAITTIEALKQDRVGRALQAAWLAHQVPQCGYCQGGFLMAATDLLKRHRQPTPAQVDAALTNLCRCGSTPRMRAAIADAALRLNAQPARQEAP